MTFPKNQTLFRQHGATTILLSLIVLFIITMVVLTTSKTVLMEQKIASNMFRGEQSMEAAETGIQEALNYLSGTPDWDTIEALNTGDALNVFETDASSSGPDSNTGTLADGSAYTLTLGSGSNVTGDPMAIEIVATGVSDDALATKVVSRLIKFTDPMPYPLDNPILSGGGATISGSATVYNPEGHSTIWSGGTVNTGSNTFIASPESEDSSGIANYPDCMETAMTCDVIASSTSSLTGLDIIEQDTSLDALTDDEFFVNFFGMSKTEYKNTMVSLEVDGGDITNDWDAASPGINLAQSAIIWVTSDATAGEAKIAGGTVSGCKTTSTANDAYGNATCISSDDSDIDERAPSTIIIEGDLTITGNMDHYGILFVTGEITATGSARIEGSLVIAGGSGNTGSMEIWFNSELIESSGKGSGMGGSDGGWRDFK
ncbi:MAG: hypothetical protein GQ470_04755 [Gammaproteobacteria bacterium]|nr:hypothetical protein [Gammaproteobacteria bacterium]